MIGGKHRPLGGYETEEEAAAVYARAVFKYKPRKKSNTSGGFHLSNIPNQPLMLSEKAKLRKKSNIYGGLDLSNIPDQPLIRSEKTESGFMGVRKKNGNRWNTEIRGLTLGTFDSKEEAAGIYARARRYFEQSGLKKKKGRQRKEV